MAPHDEQTTEPVGHHSGAPQHKRHLYSPLRRPQSWSECTRRVTPDHQTPFRIQCESHRGDDGQVAPLHFYQCARPCWCASVVRFVFPYEFQNTAKNHCVSSGCGSSPNSSVDISNGIITRATILEHRPGSSSSDAMLPTCHHQVPHSLANGAHLQGLALWRSRAKGFCTWTNQSFCGFVALRTNREVEQDINAIDVEFMAPAFGLFLRRRHLLSWRTGPLRGARR